MQHKIVEDYLNSVIPPNLTDNKKAELREEIETHIYDKAEFYIKIGYEEKIAFEKAVDEMGKEEVESIKASFEVIYKDSSFKGKLAFAGLCLVNLLSIIAGYGYVISPDPPELQLPSMAVLFIFLCIFNFLTVYAVKCYRRCLYKQLEGITYAMWLITASSFFTSGLFFPIINAGELVFRLITNDLFDCSNLFYGFVMIAINFISLATYALICNNALNTDKAFKKKKHFLSLKGISVLLTIISLVFVVIYGFAYEKYGRITPLSSEEWYEETPKANYLANITADRKQVYDAIQVSGDIKTAENELLKKGFVKQETDYDDFIWDCLFPFYARDYLLSQLSENINGNQYSIYCYTNDMENKEEAYDDVISCIILSYDSNNKINYKLYIPDANDNIGAPYMNYTHGRETQHWFNNLKIGENSEVALEFIRGTNATVIEDEKYYGSNTVSTYKIFLSCYYNYDADFFDYIFADYPEGKDYYYNFTIKTENGKITEGVRYGDLFNVEEVLAEIG